MAEERKPGYWAVLPADVRYDTELPASAKLLYAEISALCDSRGYCWAENRHFAELYGMSLTNVQRLIKALADKGYIRVTVVRDKVTRAVTERRIYAGVNPVTEEESPPHHKNVVTSPQKCGDPSPQKCFPYKEKQLSKDLNNTPLNPPKGGRERKSKYALAEDAKPILRAYCGNDQILAKKMGDLILMREQLRAINSKTAIVALLNKLDKLSGGERDSKLQMIDESLANSWKSVFPLRNRDGPVDSGMVEDRGLEQW